MIKKLLLALGLTLLASPAFAFGACPYPFTQGQVLTYQQWNACLAPIVGALPTSGGTMTGELFTAPSQTTNSGLNLQAGLAPTSPVNGDLWVTSSALGTRINGLTLNLVGTSTISPAQGDLLYWNGTNWVDLAPGVSGYLLETLGAGANPQWEANPGGTGCTPSGTQFQPLVIGVGGTGCANDTSALLSAGALSLGSSGTLGSVAMGNATSGVITLEPVAGALGTVTDFLPTGGTIISSSTAIGEVTGTPSSSNFLRGDGTWASATATGCTVSGTQYQVLAVDVTGSGCAPDAAATVNAGALALGSSGTVGTVALGNATSGTVTLKTVTGALGTVNASFPANSGIVTEDNLAQTFSATQTFADAGTWSSNGIADGGLTIASNTITASGSNANAAFYANGTGITYLGYFNTGQTWVGNATGTTLIFRPVIDAAAGATTVLTNTSGSNTWTFPGNNDTFAGLTHTDQAMSGGVTITPYSIGTISSGTVTPDCGKSPQQYLTNGGAFTLAAPSSGGNCIVLVTNNGSAGVITFSGYTVASGTNAFLDTTNTHKFKLFLDSTNGIASYSGYALQ